MSSFDDFREVRRRVMRRCVYALNTLAMRDGRLPRDGAFDAAAANGLAAIVAYDKSGQEYEDSGNRVRSPLALLSVMCSGGNIRGGTPSSSVLSALGEGIKKAQEFRHGRAEEDWDVLRENHINALIALDEHPALQVLDLVDGMDFEDAASTVFAQEAMDLLPLNLKDRLMVPEPAECDACWRMTLIADGFDAFGINVGEGICIACGTERTYEDTVRDYLSWRFGDPN